MVMSLRAMAMMTSLRGFTRLVEKACKMAAPTARSVRHRSLQNL